MTIARDAAEQPSTMSPAQHTARDTAPAAQEAGFVAPVPRRIRQERLDAQIASFTRAGYRLETRAGDSAIVIRTRNSHSAMHRFVVAAVLRLLRSPRSFRSAARHHRVVITVDATGVVRLG